MSRSTLKRKLEQGAVKMRLIIKAAFHITEHIATTTDCWTARIPSFIGLTAHWIYQKTLKRQSAALACKRLKGPHTFDVLAAAIDEIYSDYGIRGKVIRTTTDNGSNFIKAFSSHQYHHNTPCSATEIDSSEATIITSNSEESDSEETVMDFHFKEAFATFKMSSLAYKLLRHQRCACHLLHLVACKDALSAESDSSFKKLSRSSFDRLNALWSKVGRSTTAAEIIEEGCGMQLIRRCQKYFFLSTAEQKEGIRFVRQYKQSSVFERQKGKKL